MFFRAAWRRAALLVKVSPGPRPTLHNRGLRLRGTILLWPATTLLGCADFSFGAAAHLTIEHFCPRPACQILSTFLLTCIFVLSREDLLSTPLELHGLIFMISLGQQLEMGIEAFDHSATFEGYFTCYVY